VTAETQIILIILLTVMYAMAGFMAVLIIKAAMGDDVSDSKAAFCGAIWPFTFLWVVVYAVLVALGIIKK
jgi:hypothetical protein